MTVKELSKELARLERALFKTKSIKEWDALIHKYNALKLDYCRLTDEPIIVANYDNVFTCNG